MVDALAKRSDAGFWLERRGAFEAVGGEERRVEAGAFEAAPQDPRARRTRAPRRDWEWARLSGVFSFFSCSLSLSLENVFFGAACEDLRFFSFVLRAYVCSTRCHQQGSSTGARSVGGSA